MTNIYIYVCFAYELWHESYMNFSNHLYLNSQIIYEYIYISIIHIHENYAFYIVCDQKSESILFVFTPFPNILYAMKVV